MRKRERIGFSAGGLSCLKTPIHRVLLTIDLTESVLDEAVRNGAELVVAYHPPIFEPLQRLQVTQASHRMLMRAVQARIAVYSPHTALDAVEGGVNDWIARGLDDAAHVEPLLATDIAESSTGLQASTVISGPGRRVLLSEDVTLSALVDRVKSHLQVATVRVATATVHRNGNEPIRHIGVCAGAGGSVFERMSVPEGPQVYLTGEMRHHQVLHLVEQGASVILAGHTETERGYLPVFQTRLAKAMPSTIEVMLSKSDASPLVAR